MRTPKPLSIPVAPVEAEPVLAPGKGRQSLAEKLAALPPTTQTQPAPVAPPAPIRRDPKPIALAPPPPEPRRPVRGKTLSEQLIDWATDAYPMIADGSALRGRIDWLLGADKTQVMNFGERHLAPMRGVADRQAALVLRLTQINALQWIRETHGASCKPPGFFGFLSEKKPEWFQAKLLQIKTEIQALMVKVDVDLIELSPIAEDLSHDIAAIQAVKTTITDDTMLHVMDRRERSLIGGQQSLGLLLGALRDAVNQCTDHAAQIDDLLNITIPAWTLANKAGR